MDRRTGGRRHGLWDRARDPGSVGLLRHLYVHVPFCRSRCAYCDFSSETIGPHACEGTVARYLEAVREELTERGGVSGFDTIYLGGGTPTALPADMLVAFVEYLSTRLEGTSDGRHAAMRNLGAETGDVKGAHVETRAPEFTVEANPGTIDATLLERLRGAGVTRLSLGVQSFSTELRSALGRRVSQEELTDALEAIRDSGWAEWNLDLVFGIPGQTWELAAADLAAAVAAGPTHISLYDLTYTGSYTAWIDNRFPSDGEDTTGGARAAAAAFAEEHYSAAVAQLEAGGYKRYEVSNFALPGYECRHNQAYWRGEDYLGLGASAVSTIDSERRTNPRSVAGYLAGEPPQIETLSSITRLWEKVMLGLRTSEGVEEAAALPVLDLAARDRLLEQGCLERRYGKLRLNPGFLDISNTVIGALLIDPEVP